MHTRGMHTRFLVMFVFPILSSGVPSPVIFYEFESRFVLVTLRRTIYSSVSDRFELRFADNKESFIEKFSLQ